jgi:ATP-GRASP peptide maturase of grasp-with-spasm system
MVLIFSDLNDQSTNSVIDWLKFYDVTFLRINETDVIWVDKILISNKKKEFLFRVNNQNVIFDLFEFNTAWYRRGQVNLWTDNIHFNKDAPNIKDDYEGIRTFVMEYLKDLSWLSNFNHNINKLQVLNKASDLGINIPTTYCHKDLNETANFYKKPFVTKSFQRTQTFFGKQLYTEEIYKKFIDNYKGDTLSLYQEKIIKYCDIRGFYLNGKIYGIAIISQNNVKTQVDFRKYDRVNPNRKIPFNIPRNISSKLVKLFNHFELKCCSFDLVLDVNNIYWFLEINPVGQFSMTSQPSNYKLEKQIALCLKN